MIKGREPPPELPDMEVFRQYAARREAERLAHEAELQRLREEAARIAAKQAGLDGLDPMVGVQLDEFGMLAPPPPPTPPYGMSDSEAESDSSVTDLLRHSEATRESVEGPYDEGELLNFEYPHSRHVPEGIRGEGDARQPRRETRAEIEERIRQQEEERARMEKGVNRNLFMIRRTDMYRMYRPKMDVLPKSIVLLPPPLPGQKDKRSRRMLKELPPLKGPGAERKAAPPPPPEARARPAQGAQRPQTPLGAESYSVSVVDHEQAERIRQKENMKLRAEMMHREAEAKRLAALARDKEARKMAAGMSVGVGQFLLQPDFTRLATLSDMAKQCKTSGVQDTVLDMPIAALASKANMRRAWEGIWPGSA
jgi:hypothetical protein